MGWNDEVGSEFLKISEGETKEFTINKIEEKEPKGKIKALSGRNFYYEFQTDKGNMIVNNLGLFFACTSNQVREGDRIKVKYVKRGVPGTASTFSVEVLSKGADVPF